MLYSIFDERVQEIKINPVIMLLIFETTAGYFPLKILSVEDGSVYRDINIGVNITTTPCISLAFCDFAVP